MTPDQICLMLSHLGFTEQSSKHQGYRTFKRERLDPVAVPNESSLANVTLLWLHNTLVVYGSDITETEWEKARARAVLGA